MGNRMSEAGNLVRAWTLAGEEDGGSEIVQVVIVLGFAVGLGAALLALQDQINAAIKSAGDSIATMFQSVSAGSVLKK